MPDYTVVSGCRVSCSSGQSATATEHHRENCHARRLQRRCGDCSPTFKFSGGSPGGAWRIRITSSIAVVLSRTQCGPRRGCRGHFVLFAMLAPSRIRLRYATTLIDTPCRSQIARAGPGAGRISQCMGRHPVATAAASITWYAAYLQRTGLGMAVVSEAEAPHLPTLTHEITIDIHISARPDNE